jgi:hypothetical protein
VADDHPRIWMMSGVGSDALHSVIPASHIVQAQARHDLARLDEVNVGIDKGWREQPPTKINFGLPRR